jgi:hypothetical protein
VAAIFMTLALAGGAVAQDGEMMPGFDPIDVGATAPPMMVSEQGSFFSQDLGTVLRVRYNTESYGQNDHGNLDIGTMQVFNFDRSIAFVDGQVTLNDIQGVGFNVGAGYRWLHYAPYALEGERVAGWSIWADGTSTREDNFFPQLGVSFESLGDLVDARINGYIPLGEQDKLGDFRPTGEIDFQSNFISQITQAVVDSSFYAAELEVAARLGAERDAWAFAGPYFLANSDDDTIGYKVGVRGYAWPDLMLQFAVSDDEIFATKATFSLVWFVGRTRTDFQPACGLPDRLREPVLRNDYVALTQKFATDGIPLTDANGDPIRVVHVDSNAPAGGDGTFENPLNNLNDIMANSQEGDIVLAHAESVFTGQNAILQDDQRFLGEGNNMTFTVDTEEEGTIDIPETSPGARALTRPQINASPGDAITLADANEVANFDIDGQGVTARAIASPAMGSGNPNLHDLAISNTTGDGIALTPLIFTDTEDIDDDGNTTEQFVRGNVTINELTFDNIGGDDIDINSDTGAITPTTMDVTFQETISIMNVTSTNGNGAGVRLQNTHDGRTATITDYENGDGTAGSGGGLLAEGVLRFNDIDGDLTITRATINNNTGFALDFNNVSTMSGVTVNTLTYDGQAGTAGGIRTAVFDGTLNVNTSTFTGGTLQGVLLGNESDGTFTFDAATTFTDVAGTTFEVNGDNGGLDTFTGAVTVNGTIDNDTGFAVVVDNMSGVGTIASFLGDITDTGGLGISATGNSGGTIRFGSAADVTLTTGAAQAITLTNNTGATINFEGQLDLETTTVTTFEATGGGTLSASATTNSVTATSGTLVEITDMTIAGSGVNFDELENTTALANSVIFLQNNTGGSINIGAPGDTDNGTLGGGTADTIFIENSNASVSGLTINNMANTSGVFVSKTNAGTSTVDLNDLTINNGNFGIEVMGAAAAGPLNMTISDTTTTDATSFGASFTDVDSGTIQVNSLTVDGLIVGAGGVNIVNSDANFTFTGANIDTMDGDAFVASGAAGNLTISGIDIDTMAGDGFTVTGAKTLSVSGTSTITTTTGTGLSLSGVNIAGGGATFSSVNVNGATNGVVLTNVTGGQLAIGPATGSPGDGGTLNTTGDSIVLTNVQNVDLRQMTVDSSGGQAVNIDHQAAATTSMDVTIDGLTATSSGDAINVLGADSGTTFNLRITDSTITDSPVVMEISNSSAFNLLVDNTTANTIGGDVTFTLEYSGSAQNSDVTIRNSTFTAATGSAFDMDVSAANADVNFLFDNNTLTNASAASETANIFVSGGAILDANVTNNDFMNSLAADRFRMEADGSSTRINLDLLNNNANGDYELITSNNGGGFNFGVVDRDTVSANNNAGTVNFTPVNTDFEDIMGPVQMPNSSF